MDDRRVGIFLVATGMLVAGVGLAGLVLDGGGAGTPAGSNPAPSPTVVAAATTTPAAPSPSPSVTPAPSPAPDAAARIRAFYDAFVPAVRTGDAETLVALVHPVSIERYGADGCRTGFAALADPTYTVVIKTVNPPAPWDFAGDGLSTRIEIAWAVDVDVTNSGTTSAAVFHVAPVDGEIRWFADCGTSLAASPAP